MDLNDLNTAVAEEITIGDQVAETEQSQSSESSAESQENSESDDGSQKTEEGNAEDSQQAEDTKEGENAESEATTDESNEAGDDESESQEGDESEESEKKESDDDDDEAIHPDDFIKEITEGQIDSTERLTDLLEEHQRLQEELKKPREPEFADERAKQAYEYLQKHSGEFGELTKEAHRVLSIEPEGMSDRELQFEAFALQRKDLTRGDAQQVFDLKFEKLFGELDDDPDNVILKDELKVATIEAAAKIKDAQETLQSELAPNEADDSTKSEKEEAGKAADEVTPEQIEEVQKAVEGSLNGYEKLQVSLGKEGKEVVNVALDKGQVDALNDAMTNPANLLDSAVAQFGSKDGSFDYDGYRDFMTKFIHHDRIVQESFNQGINAGKKMALDGAKNLQTKKPTEQQQNKEEPGFFDAFAEAMGKT